jgi:hypothetical protein
MLDVAHLRFSESRARSRATESPPLPPPVPDESMQAVLGRRLRWLRVERGFSRKTVAARLGLPVTLVERHERGMARLEAQQLAAYARFYCIRISFLFRDPPAAAAGA